MLPGLEGQAAVVIELLRGGTTFVDGAVYDIAQPATADEPFYIEKDPLSAFGVIVTLPDFDVNVTWDSSSVSISVPESYRGNICGLCGRYDGNNNNDLVFESGSGSVNPADFPATNCTFSSFGGSNPTTVTLNGSNLTITDGNDLTGCNGTITLTK